MVIGCHNKSSSEMKAPSRFYLNLAAKSNFYWPVWVLCVLPLRSLDCFCRHLVKYLITSAHFKAESNVMQSVYTDKTYFPSSWNGIRWRTWSLILSSRWPHSSISVYHPEVHCLDLENKDIHHQTLILDKVVSSESWGGAHTLFGDKLWGYADFKWGEYRWVVTCHDVIGAPCKL